MKNQLLILTLLCAITQGALAAMTMTMRRLHGMELRCNTPISSQVIMITVIMITMC